MRSLCVLALGLVAACAGVGCSSSGALPAPISNKQSDDPCDPGTGSTSTGAAPPIDAGATPLSLPGGAAGIGFDDMRFSPTLAQLLIPAGRTGSLDLVDPSSEELTAIPGFPTAASYTGDATFGVTSADEGDDTIFATDRTTRTLTRIDPKAKAVTATFALAATPGYVRYVALTHEVWVTEPSARQIEIVSLAGADGGVGLSAAATLAVDGAESLELDPAAGLAFTGASTSTIAIDVSKRAIIATWPNGCKSSRGLAVDPGHGWVLAACNEGRLVVLSEHTGAMLGAVTTGGGVDRIAYDAKRTRAYVPSPASASLAVVALTATGVPKVLGSVQATPDAHCVVTPGAGEIFVCVPSKGQIAYLFDPF